VAVHLAQHVVVGALLQVVVRGGDAECHAQGAAAFGVRVGRGEHAEVGGRLGGGRRRGGGGDGRADSRRGWVRGRLGRGWLGGGRGRAASGQEDGDGATREAERGEASSELTARQLARLQVIKNGQVTRIQRHRSVPPDRGADCKQPAGSNAGNSG